ncbi:hypothetical protein GQX73_g4517 [Xylaria multiplex]|uniref:Ketopantoate reductase C-terminal domain-containing protein n=1 Tax=Xylaria multiplex TaxID=323545 RepID=A0A7C8N8A8_9PEZI|nr:hypothetical protein GQX73_g4517 [Xylaria multiplex]
MSRRDKNWVGNAVSTYIKTLRPPRISLGEPHDLTHPTEDIASHKSSIWPHDNLYAGRGANTPFFLPSAAVSTGSVSPSHEGSYAPQFPPATTFQVGPVSETVLNRPQFKISPAETSAVETGAVGIGEVKSRTAATDKVETEKNIGSSEIIKSAATNQPTTEETEQFIEQNNGDEEESHDQANIKEAEVHIPLSNRIHIVGFNIQARFFAHALASKPDIPIEILAHHPKVMRRWGEENRELNLFSKQGYFISSTRIPCPSPVIDPLHQYPELSKESDFLDNIILDTTTGAVLPSLKELRHRIDRQTTICLLHPGLGLVERINEAIFPDPYDRPTYILGHSTHKVARVSDHMYSIKQEREGTLYLYGLPKFDSSTPANAFIALEGLRKSQHFIKLLSVESLNVVGLPDVRFLTWKLPWIIFSSITDSICVALGIKYNQIIPNLHARAIWENLLDETISIVAKLPELQETPHRIDYFTRPSFRRKMRTYLAAQKTNASPWVKHVRMGTEPPVDYFNGYLVRRAEELGLDSKHNKTAMDLVKARLSARRWELRWDVRSLSQYMTDTDTIPGEQPAPSLDDDPDLDVE